jgi:hypothetical protein
MIYMSANARAKNDTMGYAFIHSIYFFMFVSPVGLAA